MDDIVLALTAFQAGEVEHGLDIDAADHPDEPDWGQVNPVGKRRRPGSQRPARLVIPGTQQARDRALYRITSARDIFLDNAGDGLSSPGERLADASRGRSLDTLTRRLIEAAGGPEGFSEDVRRWIRY